MPMMNMKAKHIYRIVSGLILTSVFTVRTSAADDDSKKFLPVPGEVSGAPIAHPAPSLPVVSQSMASTPVNNPNPAPVLLAEANTAVSTSDWAAYQHVRGIKIMFEGKLVDKSTLTNMVGYLAKENVSLRNGAQTLTGAAVELAERKETANDTVATAMSLRPALWRHTGEKVFLINYTPSTLLGELLQVYAQEIDRLDGVRTFKVGNEPSFEEWKRLRNR